MISMTMKHLLLLPLLVVSISISCIVAEEPVNDTENHELTSRGLYYVLPAEHGTTAGAGAGAGSGLKMIRTDRRCNFFAAQGRGEGLPVHFHPLSYSDDKIMTSTSVNIGFYVITTCAQAMYWHVGGGGGGLPREPRVAVGKKEGNAYPVPLAPAFVFRIERYDDGGKTKGYKLMSCAGKGPCRDLGLYASNGKTWLAVSDSPFVVVFKKKPLPVFT